MWGLTNIQLIGILRLIPILIVFSLAIYKRHILISVWSGSFVIATIANAFYQNQLVAGTFSSISAYAAVYMVVPYLIHHYKCKRVDFDVNKIKAYTKRKRSA